MKTRNILCLHKEMRPVHFLKSLRRFFYPVKLYQRFHRKRYIHCRPGLCISVASRGSRHSMRYSYPNFRQHKEQLSWKWHRNRRLNPASSSSDDQWPTIGRSLWTWPKAGIFPTLTQRVSWLIPTKTVKMSFPPCPDSLISLSARNLA